MLIDAAYLLHGRDPRHVESVRVQEAWQGQTACDGALDFLDLVDHPTANIAYTSALETDHDGTRYVAVQHESAAGSPQPAVKAAILAEYWQR